MSDVIGTTANGRYRVRVEMDMYLDEPDYDGQSPLLRIDNSSWRTNVDHVNTGDRPTADDSAIEHAVITWGASPSNTQWRYVEKFLRAFYGVTQIDTWYSGNYWYVTYDSNAWCEHAGIPHGHADMSDYRAWAEGEVYVIDVERKDTWTNDADADADATMDTWTVVESVGGYVGYDHAETAARELLAQLAPNQL